MAGQQAALPIFEPNLEKVTHQLHNNLEFTSNQAELQQNFNDADAIFVCVNTPPKVAQPGETHLGQQTDLSALNSVMKSLGSCFKEYLGRVGVEKQQKLIVIKSTVPMGTSEHISRYLSSFTSTCSQVG